MTKQVFRTISFGERYMAASLIYIGIGLMVLSFASPFRVALAQSTPPAERTCTYTYIDSEDNEQVVAGCPEGQECCDGTCYDPSEKMCCRNYIRNSGDPVSTFLGAALVPTNKSCCGTKGYDSSTEGCCRTSAGVTEVYNKSTRDCCGNYTLGKVYIKGLSSRGCCGSSSSGFTYYEAPMHCCGRDKSNGGVIYNERGGEIYDTSTQICCEFLPRWPNNGSYEIGRDKNKCKCCEDKFDPNRDELSPSYPRGALCLP
jgi:hypothetical protein